VIPSRRCFCTNIPKFGQGVHLVGTQPQPYLNLFNQHEGTSQIAKLTRQVCRRHDACDPRPVGTADEDEALVVDHADLVKQERVMMHCRGRDNGICQFRMFGRHICLGTHFMWPSGGLVVTDGPGFLLLPDPAHQ
jgi:hypothetical protein